MGRFEVQFEIPSENVTTDMMELMGLSHEEMAHYCRKLQQQQPNFIERNKRLMKAGKIELNEYEEVK